MLEQNISLMDRCVAEGMDIIIVSTNSALQEKYWQQRLEQTRGTITKPSTILLAVHEDWSGGAGNGLGTLYSFQKAQLKARAYHNVDLLEALNKGASIALYHTAGDGKRLYPLTAAEYGNKSAVKLPGVVKIGNRFAPITLLEAVIKQTAPYAASRKGRLSVFWGDQLFVPSTSFTYTPSHHVDILVKLAPFPTAQQWKEQGFQNYGFVALQTSGEALHIEKTNFETVRQMEAEGIIPAHSKTGMSFGAFSLSAHILDLFLAEYEAELREKTRKFDTDPHFWMASTLPQRTYVAAMKEKGTSEEQSETHWHRMQNFRKNCGNAPFFTAVDCGTECCWWDFGTLQNYYHNILKLVSETAEGALIRHFFGAKMENGSCFQASKIKGGTVRNSVVVCTTAETLDAEYSVIIGCTATSLKIHSGILYEILETANTTFAPETVRADLMLPRKGEHVKLSTLLSSDSKTEWHMRLPGNSYSFEEIRDKILPIDFTVAQKTFEKLKVIAFAW